MNLQFRRSNIVLVHLFFRISKRKSIKKQFLQNMTKNAQKIEHI